MFDCSVNCAESSNFTIITSRFADNIITDVVWLSLLLSLLNPSAVALNISLPLTLNVNHPCNQPACCLGSLRNCIPMHSACIGQLPCCWLIHFKSGRYGVVFRRRKAYRLHGATCFSFVENICILGCRSSFCIHSGPCFLAQLQLHFCMLNSQHTVYNSPLWIPSTVLKCCIA